MARQEARSLNEVAWDVPSPDLEPSVENDIRMPACRTPSSQDAGEDGYPSLKEGRYFSNKQERRPSTREERYPSSKEDGSPSSREERYFSGREERYPSSRHRSKGSSVAGSSGEHVLHGMSHRSTGSDARRTTSASRWQERCNSRLRRSQAIGTLPWEESDDEEEDDLVGRYKSFALGMTGIDILDAARRRAAPLVRHWTFDAALGLAIILNSICIAMEQAYTLADIPTPKLQVMENVFLTIYLTEMLLRFFVGGLRIFRDHLVKFECVIVLVSVITQWFFDANQLGEIRVVVFIRLARLARLTRTVRLIIFFRELWILVHGMLSSVGIMLYTMVFVGILIFFFALLGVELIAIRHAAEEVPDPGIDALVAEYFGSLWTTMLTLIQFVTLDSMGTVYRPLVKHDPILAVYFIGVMLSIGIVLMNLITAVLVNEAFEHAQRNKEVARAYDAKQKKKILKELKAFFVKLDEDASGKVDFSEILGAKDEDMAFIKGFIKETDLHEVFHLLDIDGDGALDINEFCHGLYQSTVSNTPLDIKRVDKRLESVRAQVHDIGALQTDLLSTVSAMSSHIDSLSSTSSLLRSPDGIAPDCHGEHSVAGCRRPGMGSSGKVVEENGTQRPRHRVSPGRKSPSIHTEVSLDLGDATCAQQTNKAELMEDWRDVNGHEGVRLEPFGWPANQVACSKRQREVVHGPPRSSPPLEAVSQAKRLAERGSSMSENRGHQV